MTRTVVKVGGSTLAMTDCAARLRQWLAQQPLEQTILVVGGGGEIDRIAEAQRHERFDDATAHWRCIDVMRRNTARMNLQIPAADWLACIGELPPDDGLPGLWLLDPWPFMEEDARSHDPLPASWDVSSDSIAARAAERVAADELVLLKSALPGARQPDDYVDAYFARATRTLPAIRFVNLADANFAEVRQQ